METLSASLNSAATSASTASLRPYLRAAQKVACVWTVIGAGLDLWAYNLSGSTLLYSKLHIFGGGSLLIAFAIYSLGIPFYYINRAEIRDRGELVGFGPAALKTVLLSSHTQLKCVASDMFRRLKLALITIRHRMDSERTRWRSFAGC